MASAGCTSYSGGFRGAAVGPPSVQAARAVRLEREMGFAGGPQASDPAAAVQRAAQAVLSLGPGAVEQLRRSVKPTREVTSVGVACATLLTGGDAFGWRGFAELLAEPSRFLAGIRDFDASAIDEETLALVEEVVAQPFFSYRNLASQSPIAACLAAWVRSCMQLHRAGLRDRCRGPGAASAVGPVLHLRSEELRNLARQRWTSPPGQTNVDRQATQWSSGMHERPPSAPEDRQSAQWSSGMHERRQQDWQDSGVSELGQPRRPLAALALRASQLLVQSAASGALDQALSEVLRTGASPRQSPRQQEASQRLHQHAVHVRELLLYSAASGELDRALEKANAGVRALEKANASAPKQESQDDAKAWLRSLLSRAAYDGRLDEAFQKTKLRALQQAASQNFRLLPSVGTWLAPRPRPSKPRPFRFLPSVGTWLAPLAKDSSAGGPTLQGQLLSLSQASDSEAKAALRKLSRDDRAKLKLALVAAARL